MKKQLTLITLLSIVCFTGFSQKKKKITVETAPIISADAVSPTSAAERMAGYDQRKKLQEASLVKNLKFRNYFCNLFCIFAVQIKELIQC
jgi:hypothetical protein